MPTKPKFPKRAVITAGMPYGNKSLHFGHIGGVFVPADFFARFLRDRIGRDNVLFVSGTDCFGSPIMEGYRKKFEDGYKGSIVDYVTENHEAQKAGLEAFDVDLNIFTGSGIEDAAAIHQQMTNDVITTLYKKGFLHKDSTLQFFDTVTNQFLNGRQVIGKCPVRGCKSEKAYADECDMGHSFEPQDLIDPISQLSGTKPVLKEAENWYFDLPAFEDSLKDLCNIWEGDEQVRDVVVKTVRESLVPPAIFIKCELRDDFDKISSELPYFTLKEAEGNQASFSITFSNWEDRDKAREVLNAAQIRSRAGKCLLPFRISGNISWGVKCPELDGTKDLTVWCWPESLWAPISFTETALRRDPAKYVDVPSWKDWWCSDDSQVFQFIGQDNIYFYCVAQPAIWNALDWGLFQDTPVANHHILFMNQKTSSSGSIKPPSVESLLDYYTPEQLRCHWLSLGLDLKAVSFQPKPFDTSISYKDKKSGEEVLVKDDPRVADPALKESAFLTNIFNRLARSVFYTSARNTDSHIPSCDASADAHEAADKALNDFEEAMYLFNFKGAISIAEDYGRLANKAWDTAFKAAKNSKDGSGALEQALADLFLAVRTLTLIMHAATPVTCEKIAEKLGLSAQTFFSWNNAHLNMAELLEKDGHDILTHKIEELPPHFDFFEKK